MPAWITALSDWRRLVPHRLSSQLFLFITITVAPVIIVFGGILTYESAKSSREQVKQDIRSLAIQIASASGNPLITKDLAALESDLLLKASHPAVASILIVDNKGKTLSEVVKNNELPSVRFGADVITPGSSEFPIDVASGKMSEPLLFDDLLPRSALLEIWQPINAGSLLGSVRVRYSLAHIRTTILAQWQRTFLYAGVSILSVFFLLVLLLRAPMRALRSTTAFAQHLGNAIGEQLANYNGTQEIAELNASLNSLSRQLKYQQQELIDHMAHNQSILDNLADGIITIDTIGTIRSFNLAASQIFGYPFDEVMARNIRMLMPEPDQSKHDSYLQNYADGGKPKIIGIGREVEGLRKDGTIFPMDLAVTRSIDHGEVIFIGIVRDISERHRLDRLKSEFISTVSHELRTPLTSIYGSLKLIEGGVAGALPAAAVKLVNLAQKNSQRLILLINDLLDMEKLAAGKMPINVSAVELTGIVKQSILDNGGYGLTLNVQYVLGTHPEQCMVLADAARVPQVMANLLSNSAKFAGEDRQVDVRIMLDQQVARVEVEDHGAGIPVDFQDQIFRAFAQANNGNTRQQGGTGLGLKISKALIIAMQGEIGFDTEPGCGTTFWFTLPLANPG